VQDGATIENRLRDPIMQSEFMNWKCMDRIRKKDFNVIRLWLVWSHSLPVSKNEISFLFCRRYFLCRL